MDETGFPLYNIPHTIVATKGAGEVIKFTSVERVENVTTVACYSASCVFIQPFVIFKGTRYRNTPYKQNLPAGSAEVTMNDTGFITVDISLEWLSISRRIVGWTC